MTTYKNLFQPYTLNNQITLKNRLVMAPLTRTKADAQSAPTQAMADYYARRADAGLIISEATVIRPDAIGYENVPGIFTQQQMDQWQRVTHQVHQNQGVIFSQLWHVGRVSHPYFLKDELPISPSETLMQNRIPHQPKLYYGKSRAATLSDIQDLIKSYATAAKNAIAAGFDGVEIHGANGYLIDQFLHYHTNHRTDAYGSTPENMARFALEVTQAIGESIGFERVGLRLSPGAYVNEMVGDLRDEAVFEYLLTQLNVWPLAYLHTGNFDDSKTFPELSNRTMTEFIRAHYRGTVIACGGYTTDSAEIGITNNAFDLVAIGRPFIANHDLVARIQRGEALEKYQAHMLKNLY
jgi:N-ethylmaleimide reductase